ncbi:HD-GYP domain-containing protein [Vibrio maerlii]|uniref:HD-GYP domain-containing protein n=1 Tax=Vibrio maerlii TaxID=2231648 RepID=UPI000E3D48C5|nr:two-component system response regulator [Vibrio maerlii]
MSEKPVVLIVDDTKENLDVLSGLLSPHYNIRAAINGNLALKLVDLSPKPDLILLDIMMPDLDGYEVCRRLKSQPHTKHIPVIFVTAKISPEDEVKGLNLGAVDYITKPINPAVALRRVQTHISLHNQTQALYFEVRRATEEINQGKVEMIKTLGRAAEYKDNETGMHVMRMSHYCYVLARAAGFNEEDAELLREAAPMHDVGKIGIPDAVLLKPGKLEGSEWEVMKQHVEIGVDILSSSSESALIDIARRVAQFHHEKWNGNGYPKGISGEDIPIEGRIAAIADVFDALTSERPYKAAWTVERAVGLLEEEKGKHFDPELVDLFIKNLPKILEIKSQFKD